MNKSYRVINPFDELVNIFPIDSQMNCGIMILSGELQLVKSLVTLNFINKNTRLLIPGIVANEGSSLRMSETVVKGNAVHDTIGR